MERGERGGRGGMQFVQCLGVAVGEARAARLAHHTLHVRVGVAGGEARAACKIVVRWLGRESERDTRRSTGASETVRKEREG